MSTRLLYWLTGSLASYQLYVTLRIALSVFYSPRQKFMQAMMIWLLPFLGALICHIVLISDARRPRVKDNAFTPDGGGNPSGIDSAGGPYV